VLLCVKHGVDIIYHATLCDEAALDCLEAARDRVFVAPVLGHLHATLHEAGAWGVTPAMGRARGLDREIEAGVANMRALHSRGVRILPGGDYGFAWNPIGANARDIEHFVNLLGWSPMEAIVAATRLGGEIMMRGAELGQVKPGFLADLLLVDGDPLQDVGMLRDAKRLRAIMKDGAFHKSPTA